MKANHFLNFFTTLKDANIRHLLNDKGFAVIKGQLIFEKAGEIYVTNIEESAANYTIEDYAALPENAPFELINGKLTFMASPNSTHQNISMNLSALLHFYVKKNQLGKVFAAPMDVYFDKTNVYQPDVLFISEKRKNIIGKFIQGAPELIVEIVSPSSQNKDELEKLTAYGKFGVQEYWLIHPEKRTIQMFSNKGKEMKKIETLRGKAVLKSKVVTGFEVKLKEIFE